MQGRENHHLKPKRFFAIIVINRVMRQSGVLHKQKSRPAVCGTGFYMFSIHPSTIPIAIGTG